MNEICPGQPGDDNEAGRDEDAVASRELRDR
jgi:hypothetical protein